MTESKQTRSLQYQIVDIENEKISWMNIDQNLWRGSNKWVLNNFGYVEIFVSNILEKCIILAFHKNLKFANILLLDSKMCSWWERKVIGYLVQENLSLSESLIQKMKNREIIKGELCQNELIQ